MLLGRIDLKSSSSLSMESLCFLRLITTTNEEEAEGWIVRP
jgi:hypothetical protein